MHKALSLVLGLTAALPASAQTGTARLGICAFDLPTLNYVERCTVLEDAYGLLGTIEFPDGTQVPMTGSLLYGEVVHIDGAGYLLKNLLPGDNCFESTAPGIRLCFTPDGE